MCTFHNGTELGHRVAPSQWPLATEQAICKYHSPPPHMLRLTSSVTTPTLAINGSAPEIHGMSALNQVHVDTTGEMRQNERASLTTTINKRAHRKHHKGICGRSPPRETAERGAIKTARHCSYTNQTYLNTLSPTGNSVSPELRRRLLKPA